MHHSSSGRAGILLVSALLLITAVLLPVTAEGLQSDFTAIPLTGQVPLTVTFTNQSTNPVTYLWYFGDGSSTNLADPVHQYLVAGNYTVSLTVTNATTSDTTEKEDYIHVYPQPPVAGFTATPTTGPAALPVQFTDLSTNNPTLWEWDFGDAISINGTVKNPIHTYANPGVYNVTLTATNTGGSDTLTKIEYITVTPPPPVANFTGDSGCNPCPNFTDTSTGNPTSWLWNFDDGNTSTLKNPDFCYISPGTYNVTLTVSNSYGSDSTSRMITISAPPVADFTYDCMGHFTDNSTGNPTSWLWNFGDGATSTEKNPCHTYISPGIYSVTLTVTNACGSDTLTRHDYIIATNQLPVASFTANKTMGSPPRSVQFTDTSSGEDIASWAWNLGDGGTSTEPNPVYTYQNPGLYSVTLTVGNDGGTNSTTKTDYIRVFQNVPVADFIAEPTSGTSPLVVQFHDITPGTPTTFMWDFGDGAKSPMQSPSHTYENSGNYTVSLTVGTSGGTNTTVKEDFIQVSHEFDVPVANFTTEYFYYGRFYAYGRFQDTSTGNPTSWNWTFGDGHYSEYQDPWYEYEGVGSYDVTLTVSNAAGSDSITKEAFIVIPTPAPEADFYVAPRDRYGSFPLTVLFQDQSEGSIDWDTPPATYEWDFGDGSPNSTERGSVYHNYMAAGTYTVTLTVTDIGGSDTLTRENYIGQAPPPQPIADFTATPKSGYAPLTVDFIDQSTGSPALSYAWAFGDGTVSTEKDPTHVFSTPGLYNITHVTTNTGGSDSITKPGFIEVLPAPVEIPLNAEFTSNVTTGTVPLTVQFLDASEGSPSSWSWYFESGYYYLANELDKTSLIPAPGGNQISAEKNPVMTYESPGNYTVILTVSRTGETDTIEKVDYIQVTPPPPTADFYAYNNEGPAPLEVEFDAYVPYWYYIDNWTWDFGDGTGETKTSPWTLHTYQNPGLYNVTLSVTSPYGSDISTQVNCVNVTQVLPPVPSFDAVPESGNAPLSVTFTDTSSGTVTTRLWDFGDGTTVWANATAEVTHTYPLPGTYTVSLTAGNEGGQAIVEMPDLITVNPSGPLPDAKFRQSPGMGYAPLTVAFTDLSTGSPLKWEWDFGDGSGSALQNPSHTFTDAGRFTVTLTVYNSGGSDSYSTTVWVRAPRAPVAYFMTDRTFGQAPLSVHFTDRSVNSPTSWSWDFGDGVISIEKNPTHTYTTPGTYFAKLTVANAGGSSSTSRKIYVR